MVIVLPPELAALYPFEGRRFSVPAGTLHYLDEGPEDAPPVVCLHGNPTWSFYFRALVLALRGEHRVIVPDHLGCGLSSKPSTGFGYRLRDHVENLERLLDHLDLNPAGFVLHDWGGAIGLGLLTREPARARALVLSNTAAWPAGRAPKGQRGQEGHETGDGVEDAKGPARGIDEPDLARRVPPSILAARLPLLGPLMVRGLNAFAQAATVRATHRGLPPAVKRGLLFPYGSWAERVAILRFVEDIPTHPRHPSYETLAEIEARLPRLAALPMLLLWGEADFCFGPPFRRSWARRFPNAEVVAFPDAGHYVMEDAPEGATTAIRAFFARALASKGEATA